MKVAELPGPCADCLALSPERLASLGHAALAAVKRLVAAHLPLSERRHALRVCREMLALHAAVAAEQPNLTPRERYLRTLMARAGGSRDAAETLLDGAEESFASWPVARPLIFRDVVHYVAVTEFFGTDGAGATRTDMGRVVADHVPGNL